MRRVALFPLLFWLATTACGPDSAQQPHPKPLEASNHGDELALQDRDFLEKAAQGGNGELAIASLAHDHAARQEVVAFGQTLTADHSAGNRHLAAIAAAKRIALPSSLGESQASFDRLVDLQRETFDREFVKTMVADHQQTILLYQSEAAGGSDFTLRQFAATSLPMLQMHLERAKALAALSEPPQQ